MNDRIIILNYTNENLKVQEELDVKTLQNEINTHMSLLESEDGDKAHTAAFKGYALLKKISSLDKKDYVGKLDEEIAHTLKVPKKLVTLSIIYTGINLIC